jgi:hypothetical protein
MPSSLYLDDLLAATDFSEACRGHAQEMSAAHGLSHLYQLGVVVPDVEAYARELEALGIGPFFIAMGRPVVWREQGEERHPTLKLGLAYHQGIQVELLEPGTGTGFYRNSLDPDGRPVIHHLGFLVADVDEAANKVEATGTKLIVRGALKGIGLAAEFAYMDKGDAGLFLEFIHMTLFGFPTRLPASMVHSIGWVQKRIGHRCLRV